MHLPRAPRRAGRPFCRSSAPASATTSSLGLPPPPSGGRGASDRPSGRASASAQTGPGGTQPYARRDGGPQPPSPAPLGPCRRRGLFSPLRAAGAADGPRSPSPSPSVPSRAPAAVARRPAPPRVQKMVPGRGRQGPEGRIAPKGEGRPGRAGRVEGGERGGGPRGEAAALPPSSPRGRHAFARRPPGPSGRSDALRQEGGHDRGCFCGQATLCYRLQFFKGFFSEREPGSL
jgi:hypothetical protein